MTRSILRHTMATLAALALVFVFAETPAAAQTTLFTLPVRVADTQNSMVCISSSPPGSSEASPQPTIRIFYFNEGGIPVLERELRVPTGEFRCVEIPYAELVAAGLPPNSTTGAITFRVDILSSAGANRTGLNGAVMNVDALTGKNELHVGLGFGEIGIAYALAPLD